MLNEHEKFKMLDKGEKNDFFIEVNWEEDNKDTNQCKVFKFTFPNGDVAFIERKHIYEMLFACGQATDQQKLIPQTLETIHHYESVLGIKATKAIAKDEMINFPVSFSVPCTSLRQDVIGSLPSEYKNAKINNLEPSIQ